MSLGRSACPRARSCGPRFLSPVLRPRFCAPRPAAAGGREREEGPRRARPPPLPHPPCPGHPGAARPAIGFDATAPGGARAASSLPPSNPPPSPTPVPTRPAAGPVTRRRGAARRSRSRPASPPSGRDRLVPAGADADARRRHGRGRCPEGLRLHLDAIETGGRRTVLACGAGRRDVFYIVLVRCSASGGVRSSSRMVKVKKRVAAGAAEDDWIC